MKLIGTMAALVIALAPVAVVANNGNGNGKNFKTAKACPPGLAKKNPPCVAPGQARKYGVGDRIAQSDYELINPAEYGFDGRGSFIRAGNYIYQVDNATREVLNLVGAVVDLLN